MLYQNFDEMKLIFENNQAIEFAKEQNDHDLWEDLLRYSETKPREFKSVHGKQLATANT